MSGAGQAEEAAAARERAGAGLAAEHDFELVAYSTVRDYVHKGRPELVLPAKEGRQHLDGTVRSP
ncbi:hypothetical protein [Streptomyces sp. NBC_00212]|uniref:hypothetical protein n=1 Tax=Streptomyces sp. NBC_00212 TaxID=2975684 RepID=UPI003255CBA7